MTRTTTEHTLDITIGDAVTLTAHVTVEWSHDPGCWRTANGDGWPATTDVESVAWRIDDPPLSSADPERTELHREIDDAITRAIEDGKLDD